MPPTQRKNVPQKPPAKSRGYTPEDRDTRLYRVRDKDHGDGNPKIWGENLSWEAAQKLHQRVTGGRKSRTARIEDMETPLPAADPALEAVRQKGLAAGRNAASAANQRHQQQLAERKRQEAAAASTPRTRLTPTLGGKHTGRHAGVVVPPKPPANEPPKLDLDDTDLEAPEVEDEAEVHEEDGNELGAVKAAADAEISEYEAKGQELYEAFAAYDKDGKWGPWDALAPKEQAAWSFEAASEQGPHVDALKAAIAAGQISAEAEATPDASSAGDNATS